MLRKIPFGARLQMLNQLSAASSRNNNILSANSLASGRNNIAEKPPSIQKDWKQRKNNLRFVKEKINGCVVCVLMCYYYVFF